MPGKPFKPSLVFAGKAGAYPRVDHLSGSMDKHSSLLRKSVNYGRNMFFDTGPRFKDLKYQNTLAYFTRTSETYKNILCNFYFQNFMLFRH